MLRTLLPIIAATTPAVLLATAAAATTETTAADEPLICAATEVASCAEAERCVQGPAGQFNLPVFFRIDVAQKRVETTREGGERRTSMIASVEQRGDALVLQGADEDTVWLATIRAASGKMTVTAARDGNAFVVFGACLTP